MREPIDPPVHLLAAFQRAFNDAAQVVVRAPNRELWAAARLVEPVTWTLVLDGEEHRATFSYQSAKKKQTILKRPLPKWARYAGGVCCLADAAPPGFEAVLSGTEPPGPRRDHAVGLAYAALVREICDAAWSDDDLTDLLDQVRREYL